MALAKLCPRHGPQPLGRCPECERAYGAERRAKHDPRDAVYRTSEWGRVRLHVLQRDRFQCKYQFPGCLVKANQAAHICPPYGVGDPLAYDPQNLIASCKPCNLREMNKRRRHPVDL